MQKLNDLHDQAMELADDADVARRKGKLEEAQSLYRRAYQLELQVAQQVTVEPSRSVMYRSAASLALECGLLAEAQALAQTGLAGQPPQETLEELQEIVTDAKVRQQSNTEPMVDEETQILTYMKKKGWEHEAIVHSIPDLISGTGLTRDKVVAAVGALEQAGVLKVQHIGKNGDFYYLAYLLNYVVEGHL